MEGQLTIWDWTGTADDELTTSVRHAMYRENMEYFDIERETTYKIIEREGYYIVGFSLPNDPGRFYPAAGFQHRREREAAELDLETLADAKKLRRVRG